MKRITIIVNRTINKKCIREKRERDVLEEFRRFHSPAPQSLFQKKKWVKKGGEGRVGEMLCLSNVSNLHKLIDT